MLQTSGCIAIMKSFSTEQIMKTVVHEYFSGIFSQRMYFSHEVCISPVGQRDERERVKGEEERE